MAVKAVVFDLGGVLIQWDPLPAIAEEVGRERAARFLADGAVAWKAWNATLDAGRRVEDAEDALAAKHPHFATEIRAYRRHFPKSIVGEVPGTADLLRELHSAKVPLFALTNWPTEFFPFARARFEFLTLFRDIVVSGEEGLAKPDPRLFEVLARRIAPFDVAHTLFIDDNAANVAAAQAFGLQTVHFVSSDALRKELASVYGLPVSA